MNKRLKVISIISLSVFGSLTIWLTTHWLVRGQSRQNTPSYLPQPYSRVNEKAGAVKGADERAIRELADAVLLLTIGDRVPSIFVSPYKERLIRAELNYRRGQKAGIPEANTVRVIDELVRELSAPEYAKTDEDQYSPRTAYPNGEPLQAFTAIGTVVTGDVYQVQVTPDFRPHRVDVQFVP